MARALNEGGEQPCCDHDHGHDHAHAAPQKKGKKSQKDKEPSPLAHLETQPFSDEAIEKVSQEVELKWAGKSYQDKINQEGILEWEFLSQIF